jgi:hypothetical protein
VTTEVTPNAAQGELFRDAPDPLRFPCTYPGLRGYAAPCRAKPGEPCRWANPPFNRYHAERRVAAGERLKTYEEIYGASPEPAADEDEDDLDDFIDQVAEGVAELTEDSL